MPQYVDGLALELRRFGVDRPEGHDVAFRGKPHAGTHADVFDTALEIGICLVGRWKCRHVANCAGAGRVCDLNEKRKPRSALFQRFDEKSAWTDDEEKTRLEDYQRHAAAATMTIEEVMNTRVKGEGR